MNPGEVAFKVGRRIGKHPLAGWMFCLAERLLPLKRIARGNGLVAFHHPRPIDNPHVLIVPTRPVSSLSTQRLSDEAKSTLLWGMVELARTLTPRLPASERWHLVINGGTRQDIGQLHAHLLHTSDVPSTDLFDVSQPGSEFGVWQRLLDEIDEANRDPNNGFSLIFQWNQEGSVSAYVTQSGGG